MHKPILSKSLILLFSILIISLNIFGIVEKLSIEEKVKRADAIVMGTVEDMQSRWEEVNGGKRIFTYVSIGVAQYIKGVGRGLVEIKVPGGKVGEITEWVSDTPQFSTGEQVILFLRSEYFQVVGWRQGKYTVRDDKVVGLGVNTNKFINMIQRIDEESYLGPYDVLPTQVYWSGEEFKSKETFGVEQPCQEELSTEVLRSASNKIKDREKKMISGVPHFVASEDIRTRASWVTVMQEDFEGTFPSDSWSLLGDPTWDDDDYKPNNGSWSVWCANGGASGLDPELNNYPDDMDAWMIFGPFDLSDAVDAELRFYYWNDSEAGFDYFKWFASPNGTDFYGYRVDGNSGGWQYINFDLTNIPTYGNLCGDSSVWIAFKFDSDSSINYKGAFVDDIILQKATDPNLTPYQPSGWADKIVVSNHAGDHDDDSPFYESDTLYIDWAVINNGAVATGDTFYTRLYVDDVLEATWSTPSPLDPGWCATVSDYSIGPLAGGSHTIKIVTDYNYLITETNESDNEYQKTISVEMPFPPEISSISPAIASAGTDTVVTINGSNFGMTQRSSKVEFFYRSEQPKIEAPIISWSDSQIQCTVPVDTVNGYPASASSGPVTVTTENGTSDGYIFKVTFGYGDVKWSDTHPWISYEINENTSDCDGEGLAVIAGANEWNNSCAKFTFLYDGPTSATDYSYNSHNEILWGTTGGALAMAVYWYSGSNMLECDIVFDDSQTWCTDGSAGEYDIQNMVTHELGHWLNLKDLYGDIEDNEYDTEKTMYGYGASGETKKRTLHPDDISGIRWIYSTGGDSWDSGDDTGSNGTILIPIEATWESHGRHTLSSCDQDDWFRIYMDTTYRYYFKSVCDFQATSAEDGDVIAYLYSDSSGTEQVWSNDDSGGNYQFEFSYKPSASGYYYLKVEIFTSGNFWSGFIDYKKELESAPPSITVHPQSQTIDYNTSATLEVVAVGTSPLSYQWYQGTSGDTTTPVGTNSSSYTTPNLTTTTSYWVYVSNDYGSNDSNTATITVSPPEPEMDILEGSNDIPDGGSYDFGDCQVGTYTDVTFTIENNGTAGLTLDGSPIIVIGGTNPDQFSVEQQPTSPVDPGGNTTFIIRFTPTSAGYKSASISIGSNDADEHPYDITLESTGFLTGSLIVNIEPQGAIDAGAQWKRLCTTTWNDSGFEESELSGGSVIVEFKDIPGWLKPDDQIVSITTGDTSVLSGVYTQLFAAGNFIDSGQSLESNSSFDVKFGDFDGDGDLDAFVANQHGNKVWLNDGSGTFTNSGQSLGDEYSRSIGLGDLDADGDLDAFVTNWGSGNKVWLNDGSGTFTDSGQSLGSSSSWGVGLGDFDCDGDLDAFVANWGSVNKVWLNDGSGTFTDSGQSLGVSTVRYGLALGDVDDDGDLDAYVANSGSNKVWLNDGSGTFIDSGQVLGSSNSHDVALGDVDGDGDLDAFVANQSSQPNKVWLNDGSGTFTDSGQSLGSSSSYNVELGDLDGDGDLDAFVVNWSGAAKVWLNDGSGSFSDSGQSLGSSGSYDVALGDVDSDGDLDAYVANSGTNRLWLNQCLPPEITEHPQNQTIEYNTTATLSVTASSASPLSYQWYQGSSGDTSTPVGTDSDSYTTPNLTETTSYWVRVSNACGSADSDTATINVLPAPFNNLSPANTSTDVALDSDLDWEDSSGATSYDVYLGITSPPEYAASVTDSYYDPGALSACSTYYWKIVAKNDGGNVEGLEWSFSTISITPGNFSYLFPADFATGIPVDADLDWEDSTGATTYDVYFGTSDPPPYVTTVNESYYDPGILDASTTYHWSVFAENSCGATSPGTWSFTTGQKIWTFMVYLDADNDLESAGIDDFLEMSSVGSNSAINIVVQFDRISGYSTSYGDWTTTKRFYITNGLTPDPGNEVEDLGELNHGDPQTLIDFVDWAKMNYPAERYALILWNHGGGWRESKEAELRAMQEGKDRPYYRGVCWDYTDGEDYLYTDEVQSALSSTGGAELIGFDACLMAMGEVAYEIRNHGEVMVGSEETEPGPGWPYDTILQDLTNNPGWSSSELGQAIVDRYYESYGNDETQSAVDLGAMGSLSGVISAFAQSLIDNWDSNEDAVRSSAQNVMTAIENAVIHEQHGSGWPGAHGLAIYFPSSSGDFDSDYNGAVIDFANDTQWDEFLQDFFGSMGSSWIADARAVTQDFAYPWQVDLYDFCFRLVHVPSMYYIETQIPNDFLGGGTAQGVHADDNTITYSLPFDFPYFGETVPAGSNIYICTNGFVDLESYSTDCSNTVAELIANKRIAAFWEDLVTNGSAQTEEDIYITEGPDYLAIRWVAETLSYDRPVNFELIMHSDGRIQFNYDGGNDLSGTTLGPTIGISKGDEAYYNLSVYNGEKLLTNVESDLFTRPGSIEEPLNPSPADWATDVPLDEGLDWDDCAGATSYDVYFGTSSPPPHAATVNSSQYDPGTLELSTIYYWKVVAKNAWGYETEGAEWQFTTCTTLPSEPSNPSPGDTTSGHSLDTDLDWEDSSGATEYDVYFGASSSPPHVATVTESFYDPGTLGACTTYYWKIVARNNCGETEGPEWSFSTIVATPESFSNIAPSNGATGVSLDADLDWEDSQGATSYDVYFGTSSPPSYVATVSESYYDPETLDSSTNYCWMVVAKNECGNFAGEEWSFTTQLKPWTFMVYLDGDNNLESAGIDDFLEMSSVGSNSAINIVVQFDRIDGYSTSYDNWTSTKRFYITPGMIPSADNALQDLGELNHGDPQTLIDFVDWAKMNYPAERYALILWNHGGGWRESKEEDIQARLDGKDRPQYKAVCWDETDGEDTLYMDEVQNALYSTGGADLIGFDACLMAMIEVAYEIKDYGQVMVGSEESEPGNGWPYGTILQDLVDNPSWSSSQLGQAIVNRYYESYGDDMTQSAIDLTALDSLAGSISSFAQAMIDSWNTDETAVKNAASEVMTQVENALISEQHGSDWPGAHGIAVYFPVIPGDFDSDYESVIDFANDTQWEEFLQEFHNSMAGSWIFERRALAQQYSFPEHVDLYHFCELLNTDKEDNYTRAQVAHVYLGGGSAWGFHYDDAARTYNLPFDFPYFGETIPAGTTVYVCSNGFVDFNDFYMDPVGSGMELANNKRIAPFWTDLRTNGTAQSGEDVYVTQSSESVVIRWRAQTCYGAVPVNVELVLYNDGRIQFNYDGGNNLSATPYRPTIGISKGDGLGYNFSSYYGQMSLADVDSVLYTPISPEPPSPPANPSPVHEATDVSVETGLDWEDCTGATSYDVYFGTSSPAPSITTVTSSYFDPGTLNEGTTYYWRIVARNDYGETPGEEWQFTTCVAPGLPTDPSPQNGANNVTNNPILTWSMTIDNASSYDVYLGTASPPDFVETVTTSSYTPGELGLNTTYFWKVIAKNPCGETQGSEWQFTTSGCPAPSVPLNPSPAHNAFDIPLEIDLDWDDCTAATSYDVYFGTSSSPPYIGNVTTSHYGPGTLEESTFYYWKVIAKNDCGETSGLEWQFKTIGPKSWTFMVYLDGDNNLEGAGIDDFLEMASIGSSGDVNIVVQFDRIGGYSTSYGNWTTTKRFYITPGMTPTADNELEDLGELNHGDPQTLIDFVNWAKENYPAYNYALVLWNHGGGWRLDKQERERRLLQNRKEMNFKDVCWDDTNEHDPLYMDEVQSALSSAGGTNLIGFDACLMGMVEVAYEMRDLSEVMVGSEETEPGDGWPYDTILQSLTNNPGWSSAELATAIVDRYYESYGDDETQSAIDLSNMDNLANAISALGQAMIDNWDLTNHANVQIAASRVISEIENTVIHEQHGNSWRNAGGLAIYLPLNAGDFISAYNTVIDFSNDTRWNEFIQAFHSSMGGSWINAMRQLTQDFACPEHIDLHHFCSLLITEEIDFYQDTKISPEYEGGGEAQGFQHDDRILTYSLPFAFPYFGETVPAGKDIYICTNGYVDFENPVPELNSLSRLVNNKRVAPLWTDLRTDGDAQAGEDIYITYNSGMGRDPDNLTIRWVAETFSSAEPVNFELILSNDGNIQFNYDGGNADFSSRLPTIGISKGDGINRRLSDYNGNTSLTGVDSDLYVLKELRTVSLNVEAGGGGTIFPLPGPHAYLVGQQITIAAVPDHYYDLDRWSGDLSGNQSPVTVTVNSDMSITASFFHIYPPSSLSVSQELNQTLLMSENINVLTWQDNPFNPSQKIASYNVYSDSGAGMSFLGTITGEEGGLEYWHRDVDKTQTYDYAVCAVTTRGVEGEPSFRSIQGESTPETSGQIRSTMAAELKEAESGGERGKEIPIIIGPSSKETAQGRSRKPLGPLNFAVQRGFDYAIPEGVYANFLSWQANPQSKGTDKYRIYLVEGNKRKLLVELDGDVFEYVHREVEQNKPYKYALIAVEKGRGECKPVYAEIK